MNDALNNKVDWHKMLQLCGVKPRHESLPTYSTCPLCRSGVMRICQDACQGGIWAACHSCGFYGDAIKIFTAFEKTSESVAVAILQQRGVIGDLPGKESALKSRKLSVNEPAELGMQLWKEASRGGRLAIEPQASALLRRMHLRVEPSFSWATRGPGRLAGFCSARRIEKLMHQSGRSISTRNRQSKFKLPESFDGALVLPFYDMPGRITSLAFLHSRSRAQPWQVVRHEIAYGTPSRPWREGGIAMHPETLGKVEDGRLILTSDIATYLKMQMKHFLRKSRPLQLACYHDDNIKTNNWQMISSRDLIIWSPRVEPEDIYLAIQLGASISSVGPRVRAQSSVCRGDEPEEIQQRIFQYAKSWEETLAAQLKDKEGSELTDFIARMALSADEQQLVLQACPQRLRQRVESTLNKSIPSKSITMKGGFVEQRPTGWFYTKHGQEPELITNSPFWITAAVHEYSDNKINQLYNVRAEMGGQTAELEVATDKFDKSPAKYISQLMISRGIGVPTFSPQWKSKLEFICKQLSSPEIIRRSTRIGYSQQDHCFHLPKFALDVETGNVQTISKTAESSLPGGAINFRRVDSDHLAALTEHPSFGVYGALFTAVMTQILVSAQQLPAPHLLISAKQLRRPLAQIAVALGVPLLKSRTFSSVCGFTQRHGWPLLAGSQSALPPDVIRKVQAQLSGEPICMPVNLRQQIYGQLVCDAISVSGPKDIKPLPPEHLKLLSTIAGSLMRHMCKHRLGNLFLRKNSSALVTLDIFNRWLKHRRTPEISLKPIRSYLEGDTSITKTMPRSVAKLIRAKSLRMLDVVSSKDLQQKLKNKANDEIYLNYENSAVYVPRSTLRLSLMHGSAGKLNYSEVMSRVLEHDGRIDCENVEGVFCYVVPSKLLRSELHSRSQVAAQLRVVG